MSEYTNPAECKLRYWDSGATIILTKNQADVRDAATILDHRETNGDKFAQELLRRWNSHTDLLEACEKAKIVFRQIYEHHTRPRQMRANTSGKCQNAIADLKAAIAKTKIS